MDFADEITLTGIRAFGHHGVFADERRDGQWFVVDATLYVNTQIAAATDDVADTVHYGEAAEHIVAVVEGEPVDLLETLADRIARMLLEHPLVRLVAVTVHKPEAPITVPFADVSVTVRRSRPSDGPAEQDTRTDPASDAASEKAAKKKQDEDDLDAVVDDIIDDLLFGGDE